MKHSILIRLVVISTLNINKYFYYHKRNNLLHILKNHQIYAKEYANELNKNTPESWIRNKIAGPDWSISFEKSRTDLSIRISEAISLARTSSFNKMRVKKCLII